MQEYYWNLNLIDYPYLGVDFPIVKFAFILIAVICLGEIHFAFEKRLVCRFLRRLLSQKAIGQANAKTLEELSLANDSRIIHLLTAESGRLRRQFNIYGLTKPTPEEYLEAEKLRKKEHRKPEMPNLSSVKIAIEPESEKEIRSYLFRTNTTGLRIALTCLLTISVGLCIVFFIPSILDVLNLVISSLVNY